ncbi:exodeoxyribonuclease VII small subunit [Biformimicrobium ophioploci]|uniref:Exodeoxyribonuclease 7 small subunit n=1 Tax=Biformimicrobium ophioploci TaxID=3036711 RepID=A0ABQ6M121_9GAMM|nr:exodeoxyribonuclease VII small subunit [Microbulbifer sp. NKW57]GMG88063.1 exodeoxyribonuclease VII small subunit [Microbulbifer sp. NKW57]
MAGKKALSFEDSLAQLEQLVERLESGELPLEEALVDFEKGVKLTRECQQKLQAAEQKVKILLERNGEISEQPFEDPDSE